MRKLAYWVLSAALVLAAVVLATATVRHAGEAVYRLPPVAVVTVAIAGVVSVATSLLLVLLPQPRLMLLAALGVFLVVWGVLSMFTFGALLILLAVVVFFGLTRALSSATQHILVSHLLPGGALAAGMSILIVVALQSPMVECHQDGAATSSREWWGGGKSSGTGSEFIAPDGGTSGVVTVDGESYRYTCSGGELVEFLRVD